MVDCGGFMKFYLCMAGAFFLALAAFAETLPMEEGGAPDAPASRSMAAFAVATRQTPTLDFAHKTPPGKIFFCSAKRAYRGEDITVVAFLLNAVRGGRYDARYSFKLVSPSGREDFFAKDLRVSGKAVPGNAVVWLKPSATIIFDGSDRLGAYRLVLEVENLLTGERAAKECAIELAAWDAAGISPISGAGEFNNALRGYFKYCSPSALYALYSSPEAKIYDGGRLNETLYIFFREAFRAKPFLADFIAEKFDTDADFSRKNTMIILSALGMADKLRGKPMTDAEKQFSSQIFQMLYSTVSPYEKGGLKISQDSLWGEFYAKGNYAPVERVLAFLKNEEAAKALMAGIKGGGDFKNIDPAKLRAGMAFISAAFSLMRNSNIELARNYMAFYMAQNKDKLTPEKLNAAFGLVREYLDSRRAAQDSATAANSKK